MKNPALKRSLMDISAPLNYYNMYVGHGERPIKRGGQEASPPPYERTNELVDYIWAQMYSNPTFGPYDGSMDEGAKKINPRFTSRHIRGVRTMEMPYLKMQRVKATYGEIPKIREALGEVPNAAQILEISKRYKLPPHYVATLKYGKDYKNPEVEAADLTSPFVAQKTREVADLYERDVENYLKQIGAEFKTERDLINEGSQLTPDFLLTRPIELSRLDPSAPAGNTLIYWIDAKNYPMFNLRLTQQKLIKQSAKYTLAFGQGAFIFSKGISAQAANLGATLINGEHIAKLALQSEVAIN